MTSCSSYSNDLLLSQRNNDYHHCLPRDLYYTNTVPHQYYDVKNNTILQVRNQLSDQNHGIDYPALLLSVSPQEEQAGYLIKHFNAEQQHLHRNATFLRQSTTTTTCMCSFCSPW